MQDSAQSVIQGSSSVPSVSTERDSTVKSAKKISAGSAKKDTLFKSMKTGTPVKVQSIQNEDTVAIYKTEPAKPGNFFRGHALKVVHKSPQPLNKNTPDWIFPLIVLIIAAFAWLRAFYNKYFIQIVTAFFNNNLANQIVRDENILVQRASILLNLVFNLVTALFLYFVSVHFNWSMGGMSFGLNRYIFFALVVSAAYALKFLVLKICGYLFRIDKEMATYIFNIFLINNVVGTLLIPMVLLFAFSTMVSASTLIIVSVFFILGGLLYRIFRGISAGFSSPAFSLYYLFLYLCALEIAPLIVLIKILNQA
jgi:hypothetical protein